MSAAFLAVTPNCLTNDARESSEKSSRNLVITTEPTRRSPTTIGIVKLDVRCVPGGHAQLPHERRPRELREVVEEPCDHHRAHATVAHDDRDREAGCPLRSRRSRPTASRTTPARAPRSRRGTL